jgi:uncharacterized protein YfaP (DUF2135 family)
MCWNCSTSRPSISAINERASELDKNLSNCKDCNNRFIEVEEEAEYNWSDSNYIDERRESEGGRTGKITITLIWKTKDDLDLHLVEPNGNAINFLKPNSESGGHLDIDMNSERSLKANNPIENIFYESVPPRGIYKIYVSYYKRNTQKSPINFIVQLNKDGQITNYEGSVNNSQEMKLIHSFNN